MKQTDGVWEDRLKLNEKKKKWVALHSKVKKMRAKWTRFPASQRSFHQPLSVFTSISFLFLLQQSFHSQLSL